MLQIINKNWPSPISINLVIVNLILNLQRKSVQILTIRSVKLNRKNYFVNWCFTIKESTDIALMNSTRNLWIVNSFFLNISTEYNFESRLKNIKILTYLQTNVIKLLFKIWMVLLNSTSYYFYMFNVKTQILNNRSTCGKYKYIYTLEMRIFKTISNLSKEISCSSNNFNYSIGRTLKIQWMQHFSSLRDFFASLPMHLKSLLFQLKRFNSVVACDRHSIWENCHIKKNRNHLAQFLTQTAHRT